MADEFKKYIFWILIKRQIFRQDSMSNNEILSFLVELLQNKVYKID